MPVGTATDPRSIADDLKATPKSTESPRDELSSALSDIETVSIDFDAFEKVLSHVGASGHEIAPEEIIYLGKIAQGLAAQLRESFNEAWEAFGNLPKDDLCVVPEVPAAPPTDPALDAQIKAGLAEVLAQTRQRNLDRALMLAEDAARGAGPLVNHFAELGRRFASVLKPVPVGGEA